MKKEHILISLLTYSDSVNVSFLWWIDSIRNLNDDPNHPRTYEVMYVPGLRPVAYARNVAITKFLKHPTADKLWFIDDDLVPTESSLNIFNSNADIVSGLYYLLLMEGSNPTISTAIYHKDGGGFNQIDPKKYKGQSPIISIDAAGTGTLLISRNVAEDIRMMLSKQYMSAEGQLTSLSDDEALPIFRTLAKANGSEERSEDIDFVWRAKQLGYSVEGVLDARFLHKKEMLLDWSVWSMNGEIS
jgi:hypothetical protein